MSKESLIKMLETLCQYNNVEIRHTLSSNEQTVMTVRCLKHTRTIEITNLKNNTVKLFDNIEESAEALQLFINENTIV
ncbi:hypothetical protein [Virgibacillus litoralis]|uniref:DUF1125 domain-containing protein n=1 Tax=Virgibacillus litoralis TaxID=578221 RepID=A0ABS4H847_9BACI|nr:hypothetical protein [Virgibacillus litoralis]MBP1947081.1 hypothetical protein [Virgibacillus litoralis]